METLYKKSLASTAPPKEAPKAKVFGKPAKKEHPAFDANPKVAREYLARLEAGKDYETGASGRPIYENEESHAAVHFARASEQYSAWKELEDYEEKLEAPNGSESWADKLRRKQIVMNEQNENKTKGLGNFHRHIDLADKTRHQALSSQNWLQRRGPIIHRGKCRRMHRPFPESRSLYPSGP